MKTAQKLAAFDRMSIEDRIMLEPRAGYHLIRRGKGFVEFSDGKTIERWQWIGSAAKIVTHRNA